MERLNRLLQVKQRVSGGVGIQTQGVRQFSVCAQPSGWHAPSIRVHSGRRNRTKLQSINSEYLRSNSRVFRAPLHIFSHATRTVTVQSTFGKTSLVACYRRGDDLGRQGLECQAFAALTRCLSMLPRSPSRGTIRLGCLPLPWLICGVGGHLPTSKLRGKLAVVSLSMTCDSLVIHDIVEGGKWIKHLKL